MKSSGSPDWVQGDVHPVILSHLRSIAEEETQVRHDFPDGCSVSRLLTGEFLNPATSTNRPYNVDDCHHEVREARRGDPARLLRRSASRNDSLNIKGRWYKAKRPLQERTRCGKTIRPI